jgi:hypothetical protein
MLRSHSFLLCLHNCFVTHLPVISDAVAAAEPDVSLNVKKGILYVTYLIPTTNLTVYKYRGIKLESLIFLFFFPFK